MALSVLHALESRGECKILGVTLTNPAPPAAPFTWVINRFYGRGRIPVGASASRRTDGANRKYLDAMLVSAPAWARAGMPASFPAAVPLLRKLLAASLEKVVLIQVGFSDNLAGLLDSAPDTASPLDGRALIREKVAFVSVMAGDFATDKPEYNVRIDVPAAKRVLVDWPGPVVLSGFEIGSALKYPAASIQKDYRYEPWHPIPVAYAAYQKMPYDRQTWDLTSALYAVRPEAGYFDLSPPGVVEVDSKGTTTFAPSPSGTRRHLILRPEQKGRALEALVLLASEPATVLEPTP